MNLYENPSRLGAEPSQESGEITADQAMIRLYYLFSKWLESGCPVRIYQMQDLQPQPEPTAISVTPPEEIKQLVQLLFSRYEGRPVPTVEQVVEAKNIPASVLAALNEFASHAAKGECKIKAIFGANSCDANGIAGNLVATDNGNQCWNCVPSL